MPRPESKTLGHLYDRFIGDDPERVASYEEARANSEVARAIYTLRTEAGLTQRELAARVGTTASVICRLEDADYDGHSLSMLRRVAAAVGRRVEVSFPREGERTDTRQAIVGVPVDEPEDLTVGRSAGEAKKDVKRRA
jgi:transcriptional regulator with XRE-family HTH domain